MEKSITENELIELLSKDQLYLGDKFRIRFYKHYWGYLMGVALRYISDHDAACMIVNDSFMKIFTNLHLFKCIDQANIGKTLKGWIAKITARTALNEIRKLKVQNRYEQLSEERDSNLYITSSDTLHEENVLRLINNLPPIYRNVFMLYEIEGFNHDEISEMLGIAPSSSRVYLTRAKEKLKISYHALMN